MQRKLAVVVAEKHELGRNRTVDQDEIAGSQQAGRVVLAHQGAAFFLQGQEVVFTLILPNGFAAAADPLHIGRDPRRFQPGEAIQPQPAARYLAVVGKGHIEIAAAETFAVFNPATGALVG